MTAEPRHDATNTGSDLLTAAEEVAKTGKRRVIRTGRKPLAVLVPYEAPVKASKEDGNTPEEKPKRPRRKTGILTLDDPIFRWAGSGDSGIEGGISGRKYEYMAQHMRHT